MAAVTTLIVGPLVLLIVDFVSRSTQDDPPFLWMEPILWLLPVCGSGRVVGCACSRVRARAQAGWRPRCRRRTGAKWVPAEVEALDSSSILLLSRGRGGELPRRFLARPARSDATHTSGSMDSPDGDCAASPTRRRRGIDRTRFSEQPRRPTMRA